MLKIYRNKTFERTVQKKWEEYRMTMMLKILSFRLFFLFLKSSHCQQHFDVLVDAVFQVQPDRRRRLGRRNIVDKVT